MTNTKIGEKRNKKIREIHAGVPLDQYVRDLNKGKILQYETREIDLTKYDNDDLKLELQHCSFKVKQLIKNGIPTWYVSCEKCTEDNEKEIFWASGQEDCAIKPSTIARHAERHHGRVQKPSRSRKRQNQADSTQGPRKKFRKEEVSAFDKKKIWEANVRVITSGKF